MLEWEAEDAAREAEMAATAAADAQEQLEEEFRTSISSIKSATTNKKKKMKETLRPATITSTPLGPIDTDDAPFMAARRRDRTPSLQPLAHKFEPTFERLVSNP
jgi:hypothetical protein